MIIRRLEDGNWREREDKFGRVRVSKSIVVRWVAYDDNDEFLGEFDRLKDARAKYPDAEIKR